MGVLWAPELSYYGCFWQNFHLNLRNLSGVPIFPVMIENPKLTEASESLSSLKFEPSYSCCCCGTLLTLFEAQSSTFPSAFISPHSARKQTPSTTQTQPFSKKLKTRSSHLMVCILTEYFQVSVKRVNNGASLLTNMSANGCCMKKNTMNRSSLTKHTSVSPS